MRKAGSVAYFFTLLTMFGGFAKADPIKDCVDISNSEVAIAGCSKLIDSGRYKGHQLSSALNNRGLARANQGDYEGAVVDLQRAIREDPKNDKPQMNLARSLASLERFDEAIDAASAGLRIAPTAPNYIIRAEIYERNTQWEKAISDYNEAITRQPIATTYHARGIIQEQLSRHEEAIEDFSKAISLNNRNPSYYAERGFAWFNAGKCDQAMPDYDKAISLSPRFSMAYNNRGVCRLRQGDQDGARSDYEAALKYDPGNAKAKSNLSNLNEQEHPFSRPLPDSQMPKVEVPDIKRILEVPEFSGKDGEK